MALNVEDELAFGLAEDGKSDGERNDCHAETNEALHSTGIGVPHHDAAEEIDVVVHRVELHDHFHPVGKHLVGVEKRRGIRPGGHQNAPQMHDIAEEDRKRRYEQPQTSAEHRECNDEEWQPPNNMN